MNKSRSFTQRQSQLSITIFIILSMLAGIASVSNTVHAEPIDLALNRPVVASSEEHGGALAGFAVDGNPGTRWSSLAGDPQWIQVDLGAAVTFDRVVLTWETAFGSAYEIQVSDDASAWTAIYTTSTGDGGTDDLTGLSGSGRYVRMYGTARGSPWGYSLYSFEIFGELAATYTPAPTATSTPLPNLALNRPALASSEEHGGALAGFAVDGNPGTRWSSLAADPQWIQVDLGTTATIGRVVLTWETAFGSAYEIQVSEDASAWSTIYSTTSGDGGMDDLTGLSGSGRYVRMHGSARGTPWGYSLWEFQVYAGSGATPEPTPIPSATDVGIATPTPSPAAPLCAGTNIALGKTALASSSENAGTLPGLAVDGSPGTRWSSAFTDAEWIQVDLGAAATINCVILKWEGAYGKSYEIQVSDDASSWTTIFAQGNSDGGTDTIALAAPVESRYVRMQGILRALPYGYSLWEFEILGSGGGGGGPTPTASGACPGSNIALGKVATASSQDNGVPAASAVDGNPGTRWASLWTPNEWVYVDLGEIATVNCVQLKWEAAYGKQYLLQGSDDLFSWSTLYTETAGDGGDDLIPFATPVYQRYIRMLGIERGLPYGYSLWEFEIYGSGGINPTATPTATALPELGNNIALNKPAYAWYYQDAARKPAYAVDGLRTSGPGDTRWASTWNPTGWIYVDLGASATIDSVMLLWEAAYAVDYEIQVSDDALAWTTVQAVQGNSSQVNLHTFGSSAQGRYLRIYCTQRRSFGGSMFGYSLYELEVYGSGDDPGVTPTPTPGPLTGDWTLVWGDEFDGSGNVDANGLNRDNWDYDTDVHVNDESQQYTQASNNIQVTDGSLKLIAQYQPGLYSNYDFTSGRIITKGKQEFEYGRFEARLKMPVGEGFWPAFWMLGNDINEIGWPQSGEIDVMENIGYADWTSGAIHGPGYSGAGSVGALTTLAGSTVADWHTYTVEWEPASISWYVDGQHFHTIQRATLENTRGQWVYEHPFFILLNLAVGGNYPFGYNHAQTPYFGLPQSTVDIIANQPDEDHQLEVDWVRVYQRQDVVEPTQTPEPTPTATTTPTATATATLTATNTPTRTPVPVPVTKVFNAVAAQDGWVLESSETSSTGGSIDATANTLRIGDDKSDRQYRSVLSFDTSSLPDAANISSVILLLKQHGSATGHNPFNTLGQLGVDIRQGPFGVAGLEPGDFNASASAAMVGTVHKILFSDWYSAILNSAGRSNVNKDGPTQLRLHFTTGDNDNHKADFIRFLSGDAGNNKPVLIITYTLP